MLPTLRITVAFDDGLHFEEAVWDEGKRLTTLRFGDIDSTEMLLGLLSLRIRGFVEGGSAFHEESAEKAAGTRENEEPPP